MMPSCGSSLMGLIIKSERRSSSTTNYNSNLFLLILLLTSSSYISPVNPEENSPNSPNTILLPPSSSYYVTPLNPFLPHLPTVSSDYEGDSEEVTTPTPEPLPELYTPESGRNITVHLGETAFLHCKVTRLNDKTVSWVKKVEPGGEVRLLTFGLHTYSKDERLSINFEQPNNWKLRIQNVNSQDKGEYQCQVSSHPPRALLVILTVIVPQIRIVDDLGRPITDKYYNAGSTLELRCVISNPPPSYTILWRHADTTLNYDASRGGISVKTTVRKEGAFSVLYIANARSNDSGPYVCSLSNLTQTSILVHVMIGETPAAMQHSNNGGGGGGGSNATGKNSGRPLPFPHLYLHLYELLLPLILLRSLLPLPS